MKEDYIEQIYAGWLGKIIGIRLGAPVEGWTYQKIRDIYGELRGYPVSYKNFAADDDSNGPLFYLRALEDSGKGTGLEPQDVGNALLNYAPYEHGFFWWGGYGNSTEHTAYLNLYHGIPAPQSGSIRQNGSTVAEQIGGQIFIDTWGLVCPGDPDRAALFAKNAASVTHDGNGVYGGIFVAVCESYAFVEKDIRKVIEKGLSYIPSDCEYSRAVRDIMAFYDRCPQDWRECFDYIHDNWGYDRYPGNCHIIPNICVMILGLLYGQGDFTRTLLITTMCGWDTDCNAGNVGALMGVICGLDGIDYDTWRRPINDFLACSSTMGSMNIMDIPYGALYIARQAYLLDGQEAPEPWRTIFDQRIDSCHFELPGSTHAMKIRAEGGDGQRFESSLSNTNESAASGSRSLKFSVNHCQLLDKIYVYKQTYYLPDDFSDSRYDPGFSPIAYPGQTLHGSIYLPSYSYGVKVCLYAKDAYTGKVQYSQPADLETGSWKELAFTIPDYPGAVIGEVGFLAEPVGNGFTDPAFDGPLGQDMDFCGLVDDLYVDGQASYTIDFALSYTDVWTPMHKEVSQLVRWKGLLYLQDGQLNLSGSDQALAITGSHKMKDYRAEFTLTPVTGSCHMAAVRVQGAMRYYAAALMPDGRAAILKKVPNRLITLAQTQLDWKEGSDITIRVEVEKDQIRAQIGSALLECQDKDHPYLNGAVGIGCISGHTQCGTIHIGKLGV